MATILAWMGITWSTPGWANGRYPAASKLVLDPNHAEHMMVRSTFGVLQTGDAGATWSWVCEQAIGISAGQDPGIVVADDGSVVIGLVHGVSRSADRGCQWDRNQLSQHNVTDVSAAVSKMFASTSDATTSSTFVSTVEVSSADGQTWAVDGRAIDDFYALTVDIPSAPSARMYASGLSRRNTVGVLAVTDYAGMNWQQREVASERNVFIAAIDPFKPDTVYLRATSGAAHPGDALLVSHDAGQHWNEVRIPGIVIKQTASS